jgi:hypothetical protein
MVKVSIEIRSETACFAAAVQAKSIQRTLSILVARYRGSVATLKFPNDPEVFFLAFPAGVGRGS